jgi:FkbM family methyltransferase
MAVVTKRCGDVEFRVLDPNGYPYHHEHFDDELDVKARHWLPREGDLVVDVGASFGGWTLPALARGARVVAIEPSAVSGEILRENVELNGWSDMFTLHRAVVWDGHSPIPEEYRRAGVDNFRGSEDAPVTTLYDLLCGTEFPIVTIKMDIEGGESWALEGGAEMLRRYHPKLVVEIHEVQRDDPRATALPYTIGTMARVRGVLGGVGGYALTVEEDGGRLIAEAAG